MDAAVQERLLQREEGWAQLADAGCYIGCRPLHALQRAVAAEVLEQASSARASATGIGVALL